MAWIIDKDHIADPKAQPATNCNAVGLMGPRECSGDTSKMVHRFRMLDDDGEVYYEGRSDSRDDENAFGPLDNFGMPNAGCTSIEYLDPATGRWETL